ncbi:helix-turn-helix domain-containing protein [Novosphingobium lindaniclasticum]|uniref:HTH araC/xylS-type domain-containing protein n=1 Tax=Novosphingobium lindaniclasticum LE124 TaxID=1096930 RepID=T0HKJ6_9SPHN|nr:helix-turn-helix domain-containing protein [Novosphingobium lindaniclasticum]EQB16836.1 hypothetical protein L284_09075 [Novosphingobium lindaniclasticum LE124]
MSDWNGEAIIANTICKGPEVAHQSNLGKYRVSRWRQFVGSYSLPALPAPMFVVHLSGKRDVRFWDRDGWSEATSFPGAATIVPADTQTRWLVDGELDVLTFSLNEPVPSGQRNAFGKMRFAYSDPLGSALAEQILSEFYNDERDEHSAYLEHLMSMLSMHVSSGRSSAGKAAYPTSGISSSRIHTVINAINDDPAKRHSLCDLADLVDLTESHLSRTFAQAMGVSLHAYILKARLDRAKRLLCRTDISMQRIAQMSGFSGASQFARAFRQHGGESPTSYRSRVISAAH